MSALSCSYTSIGAYLMPRRQYSASLCHNADTQHVRQNSRKKAKVISQNQKSKPRGIILSPLSGAA
jgi:hypothetical protein